MTYRPIADYGVIGNDDRLALVGTNGSIDWWCLPTAASESVFAAILDAETGGHFVVQPTDRFEAAHRYRDRTNVLETRFSTASGQVVLTDLMPASRDDRPDAYQRAVYRNIRCEEGTVSMALDFKPRPGYARTEVTCTEEDGHITATAGDASIHLDWSGSFSPTCTGRRATDTARLESGDEAWLVVHDGGDHPPEPAACNRVAAETMAYWRSWGETVDERVATIVGDDPWYEEVLRSAYILQLLVNEGTGAIYAAGTTSLPESYGGSSNWDYRYTWIRDAKFTIQALYNLGQGETVDQYFDWFQEISTSDPADLQPVYGVHGETDIEEEELEHLAGHRFSSPVRIGNAASEQQQLDLYGTVVQGLYERFVHDGELGDEDLATVRSLVDHVCSVWEETGAGIWEYRDEPRHYLHSKLLCWVALDRGIELAEEAGLDADLDRWNRERAAIREAIETDGYSESLGSFVQHFDTDETLDATALLIPIYGFLPADDHRVEATIDTIEDRLLTDAGLVHRAAGPDVRSEGPGAFVFTSFWLVDALVLAGRTAEARSLFTRLLDHLQPPWLLAERIEPETGEYYGNIPQAFSHIGLINSALYLRCATADASLDHDPLGGANLQPLSLP